MSVQPNNAPEASYFDGKRTLRHPVSVMLSKGRLRVIGHELDGNFDASKVRISPRIANTPRWLYLPDGGACVLADNEFVDRITRERPLARTLHKWESRPAYAALAVVLVMAVLWLLIDRGLPAAAFVAERIPQSVEAALGREALAGLDRSLLAASKLSEARQEALRSKFVEMAKAGGAPSTLRLEFRASPVIGPNAFALPAGILVMTDELANLAKNDKEILAVLAHEIGHAHHRHGMRGLLEGSAIALVIAGITGDIGSTTSLAAATPTLLLQMKFTRDYEREADQYALAMLQRAGVEPYHFAAILGRLDAKSSKGGVFPSFLSSHPPTAEREALAIRAQGEGVADKDDIAAESAGSNSAFVDAANANEISEESASARPRLKAFDPAQQAVIALLERREFDELERVLGALQREFERDPGGANKLEEAFASFRMLPLGAAPLLNEWVTQKKGSYAARLARARYAIDLGLDAPGTQFSGKTSKENFARMGEYFDRARTDLEVSLTLTAKPYLSHRYLMTIARWNGDDGEFRVRYGRAMALAPHSIETRLVYMTSLEPRWGGSIARMEAFVRESRAAVKDPRDLDRLAARIPAYRGFEGNQAKDYPRALSHLNDSIKLYADPDALCRRADALNQLKRHAEAFKDISLSLSGERDSRYCLSLAVRIARELSEGSDVVPLLAMVIEVDPSSGAALSLRGWRYQAANRVDMAFADYLAAAKLGDSWAQTQTGKMYWSGLGVDADRDEAIVWLRKGAAQGDANAKLSLEQALAQMPAGRK